MKLKSMRKMSISEKAFSLKIQKKKSNFQSLTAINLKQIVTLPASFHPNIQKYLHSSSEIITLSMLLFGFFFFAL